MFRRFITLLLCLTALACPATGGRCCGTIEFAAAVAGLENHGDCQHTAEHDATDSGAADNTEHPHRMPVECPQPCRDCFCAGALPPAVDVLVLSDQAELPSCLVTAAVPADLGFHMDYGRRGSFAHPPAGRAYLMTYCTLLL